MTDCNDADAAINPGETEVCDDKDNDCSGVIDNGVCEICNNGIDDDGDGGIDGLEFIQAGGGNFVTEKANPKYSKTWISTITCMMPNGSQETFGSNPWNLRGLVRDEIANKGFSVTPPAPSTALVRSDGAWDTDQALHTPTLDDTCRILGGVSHISSTCRDDERSWRYPNGKCNFHSPGNNSLSRYIGDGIIFPECNDGIDNDGDGNTDFPEDDGCESNNDNSESPHDNECTENGEGEGEGNACEIKTDYDHHQCAGTSVVRNDEQLDAYLTNFGLHRELQRKTHHFFMFTKPEPGKEKYRHLSIDYNLNRPLVDIHSPCSIIVETKSKIEGDAICMDGRKGVTTNPHSSIEGDNITLLSEQENIWIKTKGVINTNGNLHMDAKKCIIDDSAEISAGSKSGNCFTEQPPAKQPPAKQPPAKQPPAKQPSAKQPSAWGSW